MTIKQVVTNDDSKDKRRISKVFYYEEKSGETDQESVGSSEEAESQMSVARIGRWAAKKIAHVHSQILRIREEDSHIGEDLGEGCPHIVDVVIFSKPNLPASPLSRRGVHRVHRGMSISSKPICTDPGGFYLIS